MPLAITASLLMLLGSLSVQSAVLQSRLAQADRQVLAQQEDAAVSAAQQLAGALNQRHRCLLSLPLEVWALRGGECASAADQASLQRGQQGGSGWQLLAWRPVGSGIEALIGVQAAAGQPFRRAAFALALQPEPLRIQGLRLLGWRGVTP